MKEFVRPIKISPQGLHEDDILYASDQVNICFAFSAEKLLALSQILDFPNSARQRLPMQNFEKHSSTKTILFLDSYTQAKCEVDWNKNVFSQQ